MGSTGRVTWRRLSSGFKTVHLPTCLIHKCSVLSMNTIIKPDDFRKAFPRSQVPDYSTVFCLVARLRETCSASDRKVSGRHTALNDVSVENILHLLVRYSRKSLMSPPPMPPHVLCGLRGPPSWARQEYNRLLRLGRPWDAVTLSQWCVSGDRRGCSARRDFKPKFY